MQYMRFGSYLTILSNFVGDTLTIAELEARKLHHDFTELITRAVQPALWLLIFGEVMATVRAIPTGKLPYIDFMAPGILAQSVLFIAIFYGIAVIWERDLGIIHKFLASPAPRSALVLGKALSAGERGLAQAVIVYLLALALGVHLNWDILIAHRGFGGRHSWFCPFLDILVDYCMSGEDEGTVHGYRSNTYDAALLREQRNLSDIDNAWMATIDIANQSFDI